VGLARIAAATEADDFWAERTRLDQSHAERLAGLAAKCEELKLEPQAQLTRQWCLRRDPHRQYIFLPPEIDATQPPADAPTVVQQWYRRFRQLRQEHARALFELAKQQLEANHAARAYQLLHEVLHEDPDHAPARQVLGYRQVNGRWRRPEGTIRMQILRAANPALAFAAGKSWQIDSEHFKITTNHSPEAGQRLAARLEELHDVWQQVFFCYWSKPATLARQFETKPPAGRTLRRHDVVLFRDRQQYLEQLRKSEPQIELTVGLYLEPAKTAFFYGGAETTEDNWFHEVTHQLFSETGRVTPPVGTQANFWIVEGVALYMESLQRWERYFTVGGLDAHRLQFARYRVLTERFYAPLRELVGLGRTALQQHPEIRQLYSEAAGLAAFLMDDHRGRYRETLVEYLQAIYQDRHGPTTLATVTGVELTRLDQQYREFLRVRDDDLAFLAAMPSARSLSLGRTEATDAGLVHLAGHRQLEWLDLGSTPITDAGLAHLQRNTRLNRLMLDGTQITDAALATIRCFRELEYLDLNGVHVTDAGLAQLADLTKLTDLGLSGTRITDAGLEQLSKLKRLETLGVAHTGVTPAGMQRLRATLPSLKKE
jgi:hypothetical protein